MKLLVSNGRELTVYDVSPPLMRFRARAVPLKHNGFHLLDEDHAREQLRALLASGLYDHERLVPG